MHTTPTEADLLVAWAKACKDRRAAAKAGNKKREEMAAVMAAFFGPRPVRS
jgi:hypothetical protein